MDAKAFTIEIEEKKYLFEKVWSEKGDFFFYVLPHDRNERGFFMAQDDNGDWVVLNKFIVAKNIIQMERLLAEMIEAHIG